MLDAIRAADRRSPIVRGLMTETCDVSWGDADGDPAPRLALAPRVFAAQCPDCGGPLSVRAWLKSADCFACGASVDLEEFRLAPAARKPPPQPATPAPPPPAVVPPEATRSAPSPVGLEAIEVAPASERLYVPEAEADGRATRPRTFVDWLSALPAWLVSFLLHLLAMLLLGLIPAAFDRPERIVLSVRLDDRRIEGNGGQGLVDETAVEFTEPGSPIVEEPRRSPEERFAAEADAAELTENVALPAGAAEPLDVVVAAVGTPGSGRIFSGRDPRVRSAIVAKEGGTTFTEAAVARGLRWLARHQNDDGSWSLNQFHRAGDCDGRCGGRGGHSDTGATSLALLPFLGAGQTHVSGNYRTTVARGLNWLVAHQQDDGDLRGRGIGRMYAHGQSTIVLCEALAMTGDRQLADPALRAVQFIIDAQHAAGGWRYRPGEAGDTSVLGWQVMALRSATTAGIRIPRDVFDGAHDYLDSVQRDDLGALYAYQAHERATPAMSAEGLLCRQYLGWGVNRPAMALAAEVFVDQAPPDLRKPNIYYWYYASQALHHIGGPRWRTWNERMRRVLVEMQETTGHEAGSWTPVGRSGNSSDAQQGGRIYMTSLAVCTLEVYYRHLPLFRGVDIALDRSPSDR